MAKIEIAPINRVAVTTFVVCISVGAIVSAIVHHPAPLIAGSLVGLYLLFAIKVVQQWEKVAVLRLGRYVGLRGPGLFHIIPVIETLSPYVDQRVRAAVFRGHGVPPSTAMCPGSPVYARRAAR